MKCMGRIGNAVRVLDRVWSKRSAETWIAYLRRQGMRIGKGTKIFSKPSGVLIDLTRPWLIDIGENVQITIGVKILTHGYDWSVLKGYYGKVLGSSGKVTIGNNCFIGMNTVILKGTSIGDNVIVGAGSVVTGRYSSDCVIAGNPAKVICLLEEYRVKRQKAQLSEAIQLVDEYYAVYNEIPTKDVLAEFFWLFEPRKEITNASFRSKMSCVGNFEKSMDTFLNDKPMFDGYDTFIQYWKQHKVK